MDRVAEDVRVEVYVGSGCSGRHEGHVVEWSEQDAAIEGVEMHESLEFEIGGGRGFSAIARRMRAEKILGAAAKPRDVPGKTGGGDGGGKSVGEALRQRNHVPECGGS